MGDQLKRGDRVMWLAGKEYQEGKVVDTFLQTGIHTAVHEGIYNTASKNALLIELGDGSKVLKLEEEVERG